MSKKVLIIFLLIVAVIIVGVFLLINPKDRHYVATLREDKAVSFYEKNDFNKYFEYMDNPTTIKYHFSPAYMLSFAYVSAGRYNDAIRVVSSFSQKDVSYGVCISHDKITQRILCRLLAKDSYIDFYDKELGLSKIYFVKQEYDKAIEHYNLSNKSEPCYISKVYASIGDFESAKNALAECDSSLNKVIPRTKKLANAYFEFRNGNFDNAENLFKELVNKSCEQKDRCIGNNDIYYSLAQMYYKQQKYDLVLEYCDKILRSQPYSYWANVLAYESSMKKSNYKKAEDYLKNILKYNPDNKKELEEKLKQLSGK